MKYGKYGLSHLLLSWGLGLTFLWIGIDMFRHPEAWMGYLPGSLPFGIPRETLLPAVAVFDALLGIFLMVRVWPKVTAFLASIHLAGILVTQGIDQVVVRDVGLLGAALGLLLWPTGSRKSSTFPSD